MITTITATRWNWLAGSEIGEVASYGALAPGAILTMNPNLSTWARWMETLAGVAPIPSSNIMASV